MYRIAPPGFCSLLCHCPPCKSESWAPPGFSHSTVAGLRVALFNARSVGTPGRHCDISTYIDNDAIGLMLLTDTWLHSHGMKRKSPTWRPAATPSHPAPPVGVESLPSSGPAFLLTSLLSLTSLLLTTLLNLFRFPSHCSRVSNIYSVCIDLVQTARACVCVCVFVCLCEGFHCFGEQR